MFHGDRQGRSRVDGCGCRYSLSGYDGAGAATTKLSTLRCTPGAFAKDAFEKVSARHSAKAHRHEQMEMTPPPMAP